MLARIVAGAALIALAGCAGMESAGRNARAGQPTRVTTTAPVSPAPTVSAPTATASAPTPTVTAPPVSAPAPTVTAQPAAPAPQVEPVTTASNDDDIVVPGARERQVQPPNGDPRSNGERMEDIRAWDRCVMRVQGAAEADPMRPQLDTPEDYCRQSLGMSNRTAVPESRLERRR